MGWAPLALAAGAGGLGTLLGEKKFLTGRPERSYQQSLLSPGQQPILNQLLQAIQNPGAGGGFGQAADYYRGLLGNNSQDFNAFAAPEMRRFQEQIVPGLAEQFAGMGSGALSSSGFQQALGSAGTDLGERLGAIRAQMRQQAAQGLTGLGQMGLGPYSENILRPAQPGFLQGVAGGLGKGLGQGLGQGLGNWMGGK